MFHCHMPLLGCYWEIDEGGGRGELSNSLCMANINCLSFHMQMMQSAGDNTGENAAAGVWFLTLRGRVSPHLPADASELTS